MRYSRRITGCSLLSFTGILLVAFSSSLSARLSGIALASFSSGLGEMTFLQRSTVYGDDAMAKLAVNWFASGTGAAGLVGAAAWWSVRSLGVKKGLTLSSVLPLCMALVYFTLLPGASTFSAGQGQKYEAVPEADDEEESDIDDASRPVIVSAPVLEAASIVKPALSMQQKLRIAQPLILPFMLPLFVVYFAEVRRSPSVLA